MRGNLFENIKGLLKGVFNDANIPAKCDIESRFDGVPVEVPKCHEFKVQMIMMDALYQNLYVLHDPTFIFVKVN